MKLKQLLNNTNMSKKENFIPKFKPYDLVRLKYDESELEPEDLGASGIVLQSPLRGFDLHGTYQFMGHFMENPIHCFIRRGNDSDMYRMIQTCYLEKA